MVTWALKPRHFGLCTGNTEIHVPDLSSLIVVIANHGAGSARYMLKLGKLLETVSRCGQQESGRIALCFECC